VIEISRQAPTMAGTDFAPASCGALRAHARGVRIERHDHQNRPSWLGALLPFLATVAMLKWPGDYMYEMALCAVSLLTIIVVGWWILGLFYSRLSSAWQMLVLVFSGIVIGSYAAISTAYFIGYLGDNYPKSQQILQKQSKDIERLTKENSDLKDDDQKKSAALLDAQRALSDPLSVAKPLYTLNTSLKLQFNKSGAVIELEAHNITWTYSDIPQAEQISEAKHVAPTPPPITPSPLTGGLFAPQITADLSCAGYTCPDIGPTYDVTVARIIVLSFVSPIAATEITIDANGDELPTHSVMKLDERAAILKFDDIPKGVAINISVLQKSN
jgi:hypothetical protein